MVSWFLTKIIKVILWATDNFSTKWKLWFVKSFPNKFFNTISVGIDEGKNEHDTLLEKLTQNGN